MQCSLMPASLKKVSFNDCIDFRRCSYSTLKPHYYSCSPFLLTSVSRALEYISFLHTPGTWMTEQ